MACEEGQGRLQARYVIGSPINSVAWNPDGTMLAVGAEDDSIRFLRAEDGHESKKLIGHKQLVRSVAFSPNGDLLASGSNDNTVRLWKAVNGAEIACFKGTSNLNAFRTVAFSPDNRLLAAGSTDNTIRIWDLTNHMEIACLKGHKDWVLHVTFSPDGCLLASGSNDNTIRLWDVTSSTKIICIENMGGIVRSVAFSPDGRLLTSGSQDSSVRLWDVASGMETACLTGHEHTVWFAIFSPQGHFLASGSTDCTVRLWDVSSGMEIFCLEGHRNTVWSVAFSPDSRCLASVSKDGTLSLWDTSDLVRPKIPARPAEHSLTQWLTRQALSLGRYFPDTLQKESDDWIPHLEGEDGKGCLGILRPEEPDVGHDYAGGVALSPDSRLLYLGTADGRVQAYALDTGMLIWSSHKHCRGLQGLALSPDGRLLVSGSLETAVRLSNAVSGAETASLRGHEGWIRSVSFSPDGRLLASGSDDQTVRLWNAEDGTETACLRGHENFVIAVSFSPDGRQLASGSSDQTVRLWDAGDGTETACLKGHKYNVWSVHFSPDGHLLASGSRDKTVRLWRVADAREIACLRGHEDEVEFVSFSPDGGLLASGSDDQTVRIWDVETRKEVQRFTFPERYCWRLAWAANGAFLAAGLADDTVRIFDTRNLLPRKQAAPKANRLQTGFALKDLRLTRTWHRLHRLRVNAPLSLLRDLDDLFAGQQPDALAVLHTHQGTRALTELRWPGPARTALIALLLHEWPGTEEWRPPENIPGEELRQHLNTALSGEPCSPEAPEPPLAYLTQALETVDDRLLTLLQALGPKAVAADPGLPLRLRSVVTRLPRLNRPRRQLLGLRLTPLHAGPAQGDGTGQDRAGFSSRGSVTALVPSQWALPRSLLRWQYLNGGLLYRARTGREPPQLRPTVIVLDTTPACWGPVESLTRPAAHALAEFLALQGMEAVLLTPGDNQVRPLSHPADRLHLLTHRSHVPADPAEVFNKAQALRSSLGGVSDGHQEPVILLLTHCYWGADQESFASVSRLRALFVQYPGSKVRPAWAFRCERWETLPHTAVHAVAGAMGRLIG